MSVQRDPTGRLLFSSSDYCALCRETLPDPNYEIGFVPPPNDAWKYKVVGLYNFGNADKPSRVVAAFGDLADATCFKEQKVYFDNLQCLVLKVRTQSLRSDKYRTAHHVHVPCWKLIRLLDPTLTLRSIYEFAQSTYSLFSAMHIPEGRDITTTGFTDVINENASQSDVGELLNHLSRLPLELQLAISEACPSNLLSSLVTVAHTTSALVREFKRSQGQRHVELICHSDVKTLCAKTVSIFGNKYISSLRFNGLSEGSEKIQVKESEVTGVKFAIGRYGIKALRVCYASNESSDWLGDPRDGWVGVMRGSDITSLRILCDDLKCIRIDFLHHKPKRKQTRLLFDKELSFRSGDQHRILDTINPSEIRNFPKWRMCRYLPFSDGKGYMSSLAMYCDGHSITGMEASGLSLRSIGLCSGDYRLPIHLYLQRDERIESIWLRIPHPQPTRLHRPNIMILTNLNRTQIFGPSLVPSADFHEDDERYKWTLLNKDPRSRPTGIFFDAIINSWDGSFIPRIDNIGITQRIRPRGVQGIYPMIPEPGFEFLTKPEDRIVDCCVTIASFALVKELRVCRMGPQISGMAIHHHNGSIDIIGRWCSLPPGSLSKIEQIYHCKDGELTSIAFGFSIAEDGAESVDTIFLAIDHKPRIEDVVPKSKLVKIFPVDEVEPPTVMWLFTAIHDHIEYWDGEYVPPDMSSKKFRITKFTL